MVLSGGYVLCLIAICCLMFCYLLFVYCLHKDRSCGRRVSHGKCSAGQVMGTGCNGEERQTSTRPPRSATARTGQEETGRAGQRLAALGKAGITGN